MQISPIVASEYIDLITSDFIDEQYFLFESTYLLLLMTAG